MPYEHYAHGRSEMMAGAACRARSGRLVDGHIEIG